MHKKGEMEEAPISTLMNININKSVFDFPPNFRLVTYAKQEFIQESMPKCLGCVIIMHRKGEMEEAPISTLMNMNIHT